MVKKYLVIPGWVKSKTDGDRHYITARELMQLYKVPPNECVVFDIRFPDKMYYEGLIELKPSYNGDYTLPVSA